MTVFWAPYSSSEEARDKLCRLADAVGGPELGVTLSDGVSICALRRAVPSQRRSLWLNVLTQHVQPLGSLWATGRLPSLQLRLRAASPRGSVWRRA